MLIFSTNKRTTSYYHYKVASRSLLSSIYLKDLSHLLIGKSQYKKNQTKSYSRDYSNSESAYIGTGFIAQNFEKIKFMNKGKSFKLIIGDTLEFIIDNKNYYNTIYLSKHNANGVSNLLNESLLGPVLIFCLALDSIFCMHASAVKYGNKTILFIGGTGIGKSTLAEYLSNNSKGLITHIADDIVPLSIINNKLYALPHFPQLKLNNIQQYPIDKKPKIKISTIYLLNRDNRRNAVNIEEPQSVGKMASLISNTVASRLFDRKLNREHLNFCSYITQNIKIKKLTFPHNRKSLDDILNTIHLA